MLVRPVGLIALAALVAATAAQPAVRATDSTPVRSDAELFLTFDVSRSMQASSAPGDVVRLERARALGREVHAALRRRSDGRRDAHEPDDAAPLSDRRRTGRDRRDRPLRCGSCSPSRQRSPRPVRAHWPRSALPADRSYYNPSARKRVLVVFSDLDSDFFSLEGTLRLLRQQRIEPFLVRVAAPGERIFDAAGRPNAYVSESTVTIDGLRRAGWHAFEEDESARLVTEIRSYLGRGPVGASGLVESQRSLAPWLALAALALTAALVFPALRTGAPCARPSVTPLVDPRARPPLRRSAGRRADRR